MYFSLAYSPFKSYLFRLPFGFSPKNSFHNFKVCSSIFSLLYLVHSFVSSFPLCSFPRRHSFPIFTNKSFQLVYHLVQLLYFFQFRHCFFSLCHCCLIHKSSIVCFYPVYCPTDYLDFSTLVQYSFHQSTNFIL